MVEIKGMGRDERLGVHEREVGSGRERREVDERGGKWTREVPVLRLEFVVEGEIWLRAASVFISC